MAKYWIYPWRREMPKYDIGKWWDRKTAGSVEPEFDKMQRRAVREGKYLISRNFKHYLVDKNGKEEEI